MLFGTEQLHGVAVRVDENLTGIFVVFAQFYSKGFATTFAIWNMDVKITAYKIRNDVIRWHSSKSILFLSEFFGLETKESERI